MIAERAVDIGFGGFTTMAAARAEGKDVIVVYGVFSPVNVVFVRNDSTLHSLEDLKGRKLGVFGGPGSTTFTFLAVLARNWYGLDVFNESEVELISAPAAALIEFLNDGEIDAALLGTNESIQIQASGRFRPLVDLSEEYKARQGGRAPAHVTVATNETFANAHPDIVRDYLAAFAKTVEYVSTHPEVWDEYAATIEIKDPGQRALLREKMGPNLTRSWDAAQIEVQIRYLQLVQQSAPDVLKRVPDGLMRNDFLP
jgi:NitT/TauT family transport system substrate-binding protein